MTHELKIQKQWADAKLAGEKPFEIRINDRGFQKGDLVRYRVVDPKTGQPWVGPVTPGAAPGGGCEPGRHPLESCDFAITYVMQGFTGIENGYCVYADQPVPRGPVSAVPPVGPGAESCPGKGRGSAEYLPPGAAEGEYIR